MSNYTNTFARSLHRELTAIKDRGNGAEKSGTKDKNTEKRIAEHEYQAEEAAHFYTDMARLYRMGMNPDRETMEKIFDRYDK